MSGFWLSFTGCVGSNVDPAVVSNGLAIRPHRRSRCRGATTEDLFYLASAWFWFFRGLSVNVTLLIRSCL
jgi:hypothetical protein